MTTEFSILGAVQKDLLLPLQKSGNSPLAPSRISSFI